MAGVWVVTGFRGQSDFGPIMAQGIRPSRTKNWK